MAKVKLGSVCTIVSGSTPKSSCPEYWGGSIKWVTPAEISDETHYIEDTERHITEEGMRSCHLRMMPLGTVLLSSRAPIGKTAITKSPMCCNQGFKNLICSNSISNEYLYHFLNTKTDELKSIGRGATFKEISKKQVESITIDLPALDEQDRRTTVLNQIEGLLKRGHDSMNRIDDLVKSRFIEMFRNEADAKTKPLRDVCSIITDGTHQPPKFITEGVPFLFVSNIAQNGITYETKKFILEDDYKRLIKRTPIEIGDILVSAVGSFGHPAIVKEERPFCFQRHIAYLKPIHELIDSNYLHAALLSDNIQRYMDRCAKGVAQRTVTLQSFKEMRVPVPPLALQQEFAAFVAQVDKLRFGACYAMYLLCAALTLLWSTMAYMSVVSIFAWPKSRCTCSMGMPLSIAFVASVRRNLCG